MWVVIALLFVGLTASSACGVVPTSTPMPQSTVDPNASPSYQSPTFSPTQIEIYARYLASLGEGQAPQALFGLFLARHPDLQLINSAITSGDPNPTVRDLMRFGQPPDVFDELLGRRLVDEWIVTGDLTPLDEVYARDALKPAFPQPLLDLVTYEDHLWALPVVVYRTNVLWYNRTVFENAGIGQPPATWDEFFAMAETLQRQGFIPLAVGDSDPWVATQIFESILAGTCGAEGYSGLWVGQTAWNDACVTTTIQTFRAVLAYANPDHASLSWDQANQLLMDGKAAMSIMGDWNDSYFEAMGFQGYGWAPAPGTRGLFIVMGYSFQLLESAPHPNLAREFISLVGSKEGQMTLSRYGVLCARLDCEYPQASAYLQAAANDWQRDTILPSVASDAAVKESWQEAIFAALAAFEQDQDETTLQNALALACVEAGVCQ
jgi:glucose/mannose transport system substrate-binding protein